MAPRGQSEGGLRAVSGVIRQCFISSTVLHWSQVSAAADKGTQGHTQDNQDWTEHSVRVQLEEDVTLCLSKQPALNQIWSKYVRLSLTGLKCCDLPKDYDYILYIQSKSTCAACDVAATWSLKTWRGLCWPLQRDDRSNVLMIWWRLVYPPSFHTRKWNVSSSFQQLPVHE